MAKFTGKVALITGASSGIGAAAAKLFSKLGATLALSGRNIENLKKVASECEGETKPILIKADLGTEADTTLLIEKAVSELGQIDILVNNAGVLELGSIENTTLDQYDRVMNVNLRAIYHLTMLAVPHLVKTKGNIVNVSSVNGLRSFPGVLAYNISKAGLDQFTRCVALELAPKGVRVNAVNAALQPHAGGVIRGWSKALPFEHRDDQGIGTRNPDTGSATRIPDTGSATRIPCCTRIACSPCRCRPRTCCHPSRSTGPGPSTNPTYDSSIEVRLADPGRDRQNLDRPI